MYGYVLLILKLYFRCLDYHQCYYCLCLHLYIHSNFNWCCCYFFLNYFVYSIIIDMVFCYCSCPQPIFGWRLSWALLLSRPTWDNTAVSYTAIEGIIQRGPPTKDNKRPNILWLGPSLFHVQCSAQSLPLHYSEECGLDIVDKTVQCTVLFTL